MKSTITFEHGADTCAVSPGKFCRWLGTAKFGTTPICMVNNTLLRDKDGWIQRSKECVAEFGKEVK